MPILYSAVARGLVVLTQYASCDGNFSEVTVEILLKIPSHDEMLTYTSGCFHFHYIAANELVYFCISNSNFPRQEAFSFLEVIKRNFQLLWCLDRIWPTPGIPYATTKYPSDGDFARVLKREMTRYNDNKVARIHTQLVDLKGIIVQIVNTMLLRREKELQELLATSEKLAQNAEIFKKISLKLKQKNRWRRLRVYITAVIIVTLVVYFIGAVVCGGLTWKVCVG